MTPAQIRIVRASFAMIETAVPEFGRHFYERLFTIAPELRPMFGEDMAVQEAKFMKMVAELVNLHMRSLLSLPAVGGKAAIPALAELGRKNAAIGIRPEHFGLLRRAWLDVLRQDLSDRLTPEAEEAWMAAYDVMADGMQASMDGAPAERERFLARLHVNEERGAAPVPAVTGAPALQEFFQ